MPNLTRIKTATAHLRQHGTERTGRSLLHQRTRHTNLRKQMSRQFAVLDALKGSRPDQRSDRERRHVLMM
jgi:hypothetical protein